MEPRFANMTALITGAGSGIGRATAIRLADEGAALALVDLNETGLEETASMLPEGCRARIYVVDVADEKAVETCAVDVENTFGGISVLCNNAGMICEGSWGRSQEDFADWRKVYEVNVLGAMLFTKYTREQLKASGVGSIVNTASVAGIRAGAGGNAYSASKAALINFTKTSACDFGEHGVRVNAVCPGLIETGMTKPVFDYARHAGKEEKLGSRAELRRHGDPTEVAATIAFLASKDASFITGQALAVDGGNTSSLNMPGMKA
ncbi:Levodione reductase [Pseudovibrio axinellae]|uniref:Levodione reductase n=1 Tax=Pseudovibrio axinellae TaxID=989403 RepID=A0A165XYV6_9HYPH|nr:SDR family NAD(P)-dependent oxidoreductase [Pseudovibrio axinellae]KZL18254.1 Levodione reductase [Pseudovibrio axinellae]SER72222.1 NAD(P)-dependent dehydrogenase, short-chain alcohol dehydrogenase family [Pseudovibrio axinellae]